MAMMKCPECGRQFSDKAMACPNCGITMEAALEEIARRKEEAAVLHAEQEEKAAEKNSEVKQKSKKEVWKEKKKNAKGYVPMLLAAGLAVFYLAFTIPYWLDQGVIAGDVISSNLQSTDDAVLALFTFNFPAVSGAVLKHLLCMAGGLIAILLGMMTKRRLFVLLALAGFGASIAVLPAFYPFAAGQVFFAFVGLIRLSTTLKEN